MSHINLLPNVFESERTVLGWVMTHPDKMADLLAACPDPMFFYTPQNRDIFKGMVALHKKGMPPDLQAVTQHLNDYVVPTNIAESATYSDYQAGKHIQQIIEAHQRRGLITATGLIREMAADESKSYASVSAEAQRVVMAATIDNSAKKYESIGSILPDVMEHAQDCASGEAQKKRVNSHITGLDDIINGFKRGDLIIIAGLTSHGKTQLAIQIAVNVAKEGKPVGFVSLEMSNLLLGVRVLCGEAHTTSDELEKGYSADQFDDATRAVHKINNLPLYFDDNGGCTVDAIASRARQLKSQHGLELLIVDYLQIVQSDSGYGTRENEVAGISRNLKALAKELDIPLIAISQFNRGANQKGSAKPSLSNLRESGAIEQDAGVVIFIHHSSKDETEIVVAKNRHGGTGRCMIGWRNGQFVTTTTREE